MYQVLRKDTVELEIVPYLPETKRGFEPKRYLYKIVNAVLYKLKTRVRCEITLQNYFFYLACSETK